MLPLDPSWAFCPYCGKDNRPPEMKWLTRRCRHYWPSGAAYCVGCGSVNPKYELDWDNVGNWGFGTAGGVGVLLYGYGRLVDNAYEGRPSWFVHRQVTIMHGHRVIPGDAALEQTDINLAAVCLIFFAAMWFLREWLPPRWW